MPKSLQSNVLGETESAVTVPQLSEADSKTSAISTLAVPVLLMWAVKSLQTTVGNVLSATVTVALQVPVLPCPSVAESVTVLAPTWLQLKLALGVITGMLTLPQLSELLWNTVSGSKV